MTTTTMLDTAAGMSVAIGNFAGKEEVNTMTATTVSSRDYAAPRDYTAARDHAASRAYAVPGARRAQPHGVDRLVMRLSLAMLLWARHRADRGVVSRDEQLIRRANALAVEHDRRDAAARIARVF